MVMKEMRKDIKYKSLDGKTDIHAIIWKPNCPIKAILQISHGMIDHIERYEKFALYMNNQGILVCGNDHLGHGNSIINSNYYGYFADKNSPSILVGDLYHLTTLLKEEYPTVPYFVLGHSMGSFILRNYIAQFGNKIDGAIIMGSAYHNNFEMFLAKALTSVIQFYHHGWFYRSKFLTNITIGKKDKYYRENHKYRWLSKDETITKAYQNDSKTQFRFTCNGFYTLFSLIQNANNQAKTIPKNLPIFIISGKDDSISNFGKSIYKLNKQYKMIGLKKVKLKMYNNMRHEILNEPEKLFVYNDIVTFINENR